MSQKSSAESHLARLQFRAIKQLLDRGLGQRVYVFDLPSDDHQQVYGSASGSRSTTYREIRGIPTGDDFFVSDIYRSGAFIEGWLWTDDQQLIQAGQEVQFLDNSGNVGKRYIVAGSSNIGDLNIIFSKYRLTSMDIP